MTDFFDRLVDAVLHPTSDVQPLILPQYASAPAAERVVPPESEPFVLASAPETGARNAPPEDMAANEPPTLVPVDTSAPDAPVRTDATPPHIAALPTAPASQPTAVHDTRTAPRPESARREETPGAHPAAARQADPRPTTPMPPPAAPGTHIQVAAPMPAEPSPTVRDAAAAGLAPPQLLVPPEHTPPAPHGSAPTRSALAPQPVSAAPSPPNAPRPIAEQTQGPAEQESDRRDAPALLPHADERPLATQATPGRRVTQRGESQREASPSPPAIVSNRELPTVAPMSHAETTAPPRAPSAPDRDQPVAPPFQEPAQPRMYAARAIPPHTDTERTAPTSEQVRRPLPAVAPHEPPERTPWQAPAIRAAAATDILPRALPDAPRPTTGTAATAPPITRVTIGRVDVRAIMPPAAPPAPPAPERLVPSLQDYLRRRSGGGA